MSVQLFDFFEKFDINDGEVNIECHEYNDDGSEKMELNISTNIATNDFMTPKTNDSAQENNLYQSEIVSENSESQNQNLEAHVQNLDDENENFEASFDVSHESNFNPESPMTKENASFFTPFSIIETQPTVPLRNEESEINDSKNVPKGMMKAFAHMVLKKDPKTLRILKGYFDKSEESFEKFKERMKKIRKSSKINIGEIKIMLIDGEFACTMRKLGGYFLRKRFLNHIFNSKMEKRHIHMKYIPRWLEIFKNPYEFNSLK